MRTVGVDVEQALLRLPLDLRDAQGKGLQLPDPAATLGCRFRHCPRQGLGLQDKYALLARAAPLEALSFSMQHDRLTICARACQRGCCRISSIRCAFLR